MNLIFQRSQVLIFISIAVNSALIAQSVDSWTAWRGPNQNGTASKTARPPIRWSNTENIAWTAELPGTGTSTPIVWDGKIFVLSAKPTDRKADSPVAMDERMKTTPPNVFFQFILTCVDLNSGKRLWSRVCVEEVPHEGRHPTHTYAGSSPTTDGKRLYVSFGSRGIFAYSFDGDPLWNTDLGDMITRRGWGEAVTPVVHNGSLIVNWDQEEGSFITCLDAESGEAKWKTPRPNEVTSWNTPLVTEVDGKAVAVVNGTHRVRAYDLASGQELWSCGGQTVNAIPSPVRFGDHAIVMSGYRGSNASSIPLKSRGEISASADVSWAIKGGTPYVPSPLLVGNRLYFTSTNRNVLSIINAATGERLAEPMRLTALRNIYASPVATADHIYILDREGTCVVLSIGDDPELIAVNKLNDTTDASPVIIGNQLLIRSWNKLYCIANDSDR